MEWFYSLANGLVNNTFGFFAIPTIAIITLVAVVHGLTKHRGRSHLWWIVSCAVISLVAFILTGLILYRVSDYLMHGTR